MWQAMRLRTVVFLVKVWAEYAEQDPPALRGELKCLESGQQHLFKDLEELTSLISQLAEPAPSPTPKESHE